MRGNLLRRLISARWMPRVYPRPCGETRPFGKCSDCGYRRRLGLSPPMRGNLSGPVECRCRLHVSGLSPPMRGNLRLQEQSQCIDYPAQLPIGLRRVYPRPCGETPPVRPMTVMDDAGLSPPMRGNLGPVFGRRRISGTRGLSPPMRGNHSIPASWPVLAGNRVYPRPCGETITSMLPLMSTDIGSIPAHAGKPRPMFRYRVYPRVRGKVGTEFYRVYPRPCGETDLDPPIDCLRDWGLSPPMRGNL